MVKIGIIIGSTRPGRIGEAVAEWGFATAKKRPDARFEIVDIKSLNLPLLDEPMPPSMGQCSKPRTKARAGKVASWDASVFVTPEYNHAPPAALKSALGSVYAEWSNKAAGFASFEDCSVFKPKASHEADLATMLDQLVAWGEAMKAPRR